MADEVRGVGFCREGIVAVSTGLPSWRVMRLRFDGDAWIKTRVPVVVSTELVVAFSPRSRRNVTTTAEEPGCGRRQATSR